MPASRGWVFCPLSLTLTANLHGKQNEICSYSLYRCQYVLLRSSIRTNYSPRCKRPAYLSRLLQRLQQRLPSLQPLVAAKTAVPSASAAAKTSVTAKTAVGGGAGKVWVNSGSKVYHCEGSKFYGKTKAGEYMTEAEAKAKGSHADHGKACTK